MKQMNRKFLSLMLSVSMVLCMGATALAADDGDATGKGQQIEAMEQEKAEQSAELDSLNEEKNTVQTDLENLDSQLSDIHDQIAATNKDLETAQAALDQTNKDLEAATEDEATQYEALKKRIRVMYRKGNTAYLEILNNSSDLTTLLNSTEYIAKISDYDANLLKNLQDTREEIAALQADQEAQVAEIADIKTTQEEEQTHLQDIVSEKEAYVLSLNDSIEMTEENIAVLTENIEAEEAALSEIEAAIAAAAAERNQEQEVTVSYEEPVYEETTYVESVYEEPVYEETVYEEVTYEETVYEEVTYEESSDEEVTYDETTYDETTYDDTTYEETTYEETTYDDTTYDDTTYEETTYEEPVYEESVYEEPETEDTASEESSYTSSGWVWPSDTTTLTDTYGYQDWRGGSHNGIDIGASYGDPIYAAASGTVWIAGWSDSAGNWVVIDHGGGVLSVYMHASALYVSAGETVSAGQSIAAVGSTGDSTGPHLHFGVMVGCTYGYDGSWVNPLEYVSP